MKSMLVTVMMLFAAPILALPSMVGTWQCDKGGRLTFGANGTMTADGMGVKLSGTYSMTSRGYVFVVMGKSHEDVITHWDANTFERHPVESPSFRDTCRRISSASCQTRGKCLSGNCANGVGVEDWDGIKYEGPYLNCEWNGKATVTIDGIRFTGVWRKHGEFPDYVEILFPDQSTYQGGFDQGKPSGKGVFVSPSGVRYEGEFKAGRKHGFGVMVFPTGNRYEGTWNDTVPVGGLKVTFANGDRYQGETSAFENGKEPRPAGQGTYVWKNGSKYVGMWKEGKRHGQGIQYRPDGSIEAQGEFLEDNPPR